MSESSDRLEAELSAMRPHRLSPRLRRRVADHLAEPRPRRWAWGVALTGMAAAVGGLALIVPWWFSPAPLSPRGLLTTPPAAIEWKSTVPALGTYQRALARSPEDLDALLDRSVAAGPNADFARMPVVTLVRSSATIDAILGDH